MYQTILFDLDGTLTDPDVGITECVRHALKKMGIDEPDRKKLRPFIGPPLRDSFREFYGFDEAQAEKAVAWYRERFSQKGMFENEIYPGIRELLAGLKAEGRNLVLASSKPELFVNRILEHFGIAGYFSVVVGSELDGTRDKKEEVIAEALQRMTQKEMVSAGAMAMVGDRRFDMEGAQEHGMAGIGVTYGYGSRQELEQAGASHIVENVEELTVLLMGKNLIV